MSNICKGICIRKKAGGSSNRLRYALGQKFCSICRVYFDTDRLRCECCGTKALGQNQEHQKVRKSMPY